MYIQGEVLIYMYVCNVTWQPTSSDQYKKLKKIVPVYRTIPVLFVYDLV